jgi:2-(1,2-epoxy-1,2-dihydrophenyl)acetyl-CoA isomerase
MTEETPDSPVLYAVADGVATITLNRPDAMNSLDVATKEALLDAVTRAAEDSAVRCLVLTGTGRAFCVGQDLKEHIQILQSGSTDQLFTTVDAHYNPLVKALATMPKPVIAAVNGVAAGAGASLAFACDLRIAAADARFVLAFGRIGLVPDSGATWFLPRLVGSARAAEMAFVGDPVSAEDALRFGLVSSVVPPADLLTEARAMADRIAAGAPLAMALTKGAFERAETIDLETALEGEAKLQGIAGASADHAEGLAAFREKRTPRFTGE